MKRSALLPKMKNSFISRNMTQTTTTATTKPLIWEMQPVQELMHRQK